MYKAFDYYCNDCDKTEERLVDSTDVDKQSCSNCSRLMAKQVSFTKTRGIVVGGLSNNVKDFRK